MVEAELRAKLDAPELALDFTSLYAADVQGRARAFRSLVGTKPEASLERDEARRLVGL